MRQFCIQNPGVSLSWVYLEAGHGKGVPDGIGAAAKRAIDNIMGDYPKDPIYSVEDLLDLGLEAYLPSIVVLKHTPAEVDEVLKSIPKHNSVPGTMRFHEFTAMPDTTGEVKLYSKENSGESTQKVFCLIPKSEKKMPNMKALQDVCDDENSSCDEGDAVKSASEEDDEDNAAEKQKEDAPEDDIDMEVDRSPEEGRWVVVKYYNQKFPGIVLVSEASRFRPNCMQPVLNSPGHWKWPRKADNKIWYDAFDYIESPTEVKKNVYVFEDWSA